MIEQKTWKRYSLAALLSLVIWFFLTYPRFSFIDLSIDRNQATKIARSYVSQKLGVDLTPYQQAILFSGRRDADRYLQRTVGFENELRFFKQHDYELFFWNIRFYRENQKEEYFVKISAATGEIVSFDHTIKSSAQRADFGETAAKKLALQFLITRFNFQPDHYILKANLAKKHDNRTDYSFIWQKKGIFIRWSEKENTGGAKLLTGVKVSGKEVLAFYKNSLEIPDEFNRDLARRTNIGNNLSVVFRMVFFTLLVASIFFVIVRRNNLILHTIKKFSIAVTGVLFFIYLLNYFNEFERVLAGYPTTSSFASYLWRNISNLILDTFIISVTFLMPFLAGESLRYEHSPEHKRGSFLLYINSTFFSRSVAKLIALGYLATFIMIGLQSIFFEIGQRYLGVWVEYTWMSSLTASYVPFLNAFIIGFIASLTEEINFRLFAINFGKKFLKNTFFAVLLSSLIWGYGHSNYPVFPMWFRGLEVTALGLFLSYIYLRFGLIPALVAHYLFDAFWCGSAYLFGQTTPYLFYGALFVICLPLLFAFIAYLLNRPEKEREMAWQLNKHQKYNLDVLRNYLVSQCAIDTLSLDELRRLRNDVIAHGWDIAVVELAINEIRNEKVF